MDVEPISLIIGMPPVGVNPMSFFAGKEKDSGLVGLMNEKYNLARTKRGFSITSINDIVVQFPKKVLSSTLLINI